jgi:hypothetical protein
MSKEIRYAGFSVLADGTFKFRTASDQRRIDQLIGFGEQVSMVFLDKPAGSKSEAAKMLLAQTDDRWIPEAQALFVKTARDDNPFKPKKKSGTVRVKSTKGDPVEAYFLAAEADDVKLTPKQAAKIRAEFNARVKAAYEAN